MAIAMSTRSSSKAAVAKSNTISSGGAHPSPPRKRFLALWQIGGLVASASQELQAIHEVCARRDLMPLVVEVGEVLHYFAVRVARGDLESSGFGPFFPIPDAHQISSEGAGRDLERSQLK